MKSKAQNQPTAQKNIFTNSGIRDIAGKGLLQEQELYTIGEAISTLLSEDVDQNCNIIIASDNRTSSPWIKAALIKGLATHDINIYDAGICPTPFIAKALKDFQPEHLDQQNHDDDIDDFDEEEENSFFTLGIMITASHNPPEDNGIKILTNFGYLTPELELEISEIFEDLMQVPETIPTRTPDCISLDLVAFYEQKVLNQLENETFSNISVVLDCGYGATANIAPRIFQAAGISTIAINNQSDGTKINQNSGCSNPELLLQAIKEHNTSWGCAFDGDGDRVIIAHQSGKIFDGDDLLILISQHPDYEKYKKIVGTFMTNQGVAEFATTHHKNLIRTQVGERNVIQALIAHQAMIGSETCGHITIMDHAFCSDGIFAALLFFDTITTYPAILSTSYTKYPQVHANIKLHGKSLDTKTIGMIVSPYQNNQTRIVVRPSNTQSVLRIMVEHHDQQHAVEVLEKLQQICIEKLT